MADTAGSGIDARLLVIGVGNRDRGDDAVGPIVCDLVRESDVAGVDLVVFEGAMVDLALHWQSSDDVVIIDAAEPIDHPGHTVVRDALVEPLRPPDTVSTHSIDVTAAIELARAIDRLPATLTLVGIEAMSCDHGAPLTPAVAHAAGRVVTRIRRRQLRSPRPSAQMGR